MSAWRTWLIAKVASIFSEFKIILSGNCKAAFKSNAWIGGVDLLGSAFAVEPGTDHDKPVWMLTGDLEGGIVAKIDGASRDYVHMPSWRGCSCRLGQKEEWKWSVRLLMSLSSVFECQPVPHTLGITEHKVAPYWATKPNISHSPEKAVKSG